jgi:hypothetical protein
VKIVDSRLPIARGGLCAYVFEPTDLDGDERDELAIDVSSGGATVRGTEITTPV